MGPVGHTVISSVLGAAIWLATDSVEAAGVAVGVGVLMDVDHLYDCYQRYIKGNGGEWKAQDRLEATHVAVVGIGSSFWRNSFGDGCSHAL